MGTSTIVQLTPTRALLAVVTACAVLLGTQSAAHADSYTQEDATGDVVRDHRETGASTPRPQRKHGDIRKAVTRHAEAQVVHRVHFVRLRKTRRDLALYVTIKTGERYYFVELAAGPGNRRGTMRLHSTEARSAATCGEHRIRYARNLIAIRLPHDCVGSPPWIRVSTGFHVDAAQRAYGFFDDAHRTRLAGADGQMTPRIHYTAE